MARARNIKPGFFKNEDLAECTPWARLCFAGLWCLADREGRLEDRPKRIKGELFPSDTVDVEPLLQELVRWKFIHRYEIDGVRVIQILKFSEHQTPHYSEKPSVIKPPPLPEFGAIKTPSRQDDSEKSTPIKRGAQPPDSPNPDSPNPDTGILIPDSPNPDTAPSVLFPAEPAAQPAPPPKKRAPRKPPNEPPPTAGTWKAYARAYETRYSVEPVRNATVNGQLANLVKRLGAEEAPSVAAHYVRSNNSRYVSCGHGVGMLVQDAEKLRTEWATGRQGTATQARLADRAQSNLNAFAPLIDEARARQRETHGDT